MSGPATACNQGHSSAFEMQQSSISGLTLGRSTTTSIYHLLIHLSPHVTMATASFLASCRFKSVVMATFQLSYLHCIDAHKISIFPIKFYNAATFRTVPCSQHSGNFWGRTFLLYNKFPQRWGASYMRIHPTYHIYSYVWSTFFQ